MRRDHQPQRLTEGLEPVEAPHSETLDRGDQGPRPTWRVRDAQDSTLSQLEDSTFSFVRHSPGQLSLAECSPEPGVVGRQA